MGRSWGVCERDPTARRPQRASASAARAPEPYEASAFSPVGLGRLHRGECHVVQRHLCRVITQNMMARTVLVVASTLCSAESALNNCLPDFDFRGGSTVLLNLARTLQLPNPNALIRHSPVTVVKLGSELSRSTNVNVTLHSYPEDRMIRMLQKEAERDAYDLASRITEGDLLDVGGHIGLTALLFHKLHPTAHVYVFEPAPLNFFYLAYNAMRNGADSTRVHLYNRRLSKDGESFVIEYSPDDTPSTRRASLGHSWGSHTKHYHIVHTLSMKQLWNCLPLHHVGLIKLDCEGCEFDLVPSEPRFFSARARRVVGEFHGWHVTQPGHAGNVSQKLIQKVKTLLCNRERSAEDRLEWLRGPPGWITSHGTPGKGC